MSAMTRPDGINQPKYRPPYLNYPARPTEHHIPRDYLPRAYNPRNYSYRPDNPQYRNLGPDVVPPRISVGEPYNPEGYLIKSAGPERYGSRPDINYGPRSAIGSEGYKMNPPDRYYYPPRPDYGYHMRPDPSHARRSASVDGSQPRPTGIEKPDLNATNGADPNPNLGSFSQLADAASNEANLSANFNTEPIQGKSSQELSQISGSDPLHNIARPATASVSYDSRIMSFRPPLPGSLDRRSSHETSRSFESYDYDPRYYDRRTSEPVNYSEPYSYPYSQPYQYNAGYNPQCILY